MYFILLTIQMLLMNWYIAKIVMRITSENTDHTPQFDEQLRLIQASGTAEAFMKARIIGIAEEDAYLNSHRNEVRWEFINVADIVPVKTFSDGAEIYSHVHETNEAPAYIHDVHEKAMFIRKSNQALN